MRRRSDPPVAESRNDGSIDDNSITAGGAGIPSVRPGGGTLSHASAATDDETRACGVDRHDPLRPPGYEQRARWSCVGRPTCSFAYGTLTLVDNGAGWDWIDVWQDTDGTVFATVDPLPGGDSSGSLLWGVLAGSKIEPAAALRAASEQQLAIGTIQASARRRRPLT